MSPSTAWKMRPFVVALVLGLAPLFAASTALGQGRAEAPAMDLQKKAMEEDYLMTDFAKAREKLENAISQCGTDACSPALRARLRRDLGVVLIGGEIDREKGIASFAEALQIDPSVELDPDLKTKELEEAFAEAKTRPAGGPAAPQAPGVGAPAGVPGQPEGDFVHTPVAAQQVRTAIPVYVEYHGEEQLVRVLVRYKGFGMTEWKPTELRRIGNGWGGLLPCGDVQQGTTQYYVQGFDANNDPVAVGGDRNNPYKVPVTREPVAEPPHLPNASPPTQCADTGDCPPNFPGCRKPSATGADEETGPTGKEGGAFCEEDSDCKSNRCIDMQCAEYKGKGKAPKLWLGIAGTFDYAFVPSADDVCKLDEQTYPLNDQNYYCVRSDGTDYPSRDPRAGKLQNDLIIHSKDQKGDQRSDRVSGGGALGNIRLMLTLDYAAHPNVLVGGRLGVVLNTMPNSAEAASQDGKRFAVPIHLEVRGTYLFGKDPLEKQGMSPFAFGALGIGQFETNVPVTTHELQHEGACLEGADPIQGKSVCRREVDAWHLAGPAFFSLGGGIRYAVSEKFALMAGLRLNLAFLNAFAPSVGPEIGGHFGL